MADTGKAKVHFYDDVDMKKVQALRQQLGLGLAQTRLPGADICACPAQVLEAPKMAKDIAGTKGAFTRAARAQRTHCPAQDLAAGSARAPTGFHGQLPRADC